MLKKLKPGRRPELSARVRAFIEKPGNAGRFTASEVAARCGCCRSLVYDIARASRLKGRKNERHRP